MAPLAVQFIGIEFRIVYPLALNRDGRIVHEDVERWEKRALS